MTTNFTTITNNELQDKYPEVHYYINSYYPVGLRKDDEKYSSFFGIQQLDSQTKSQIADKVSYKRIWELGFISKLKSSLKSKEILSTTAGLVPSFSGVIKLKETETYKTELHFYKSLINNYYSIEILDINKRKKIIHPILGEKIIIGIDTITVSPEGEYKALFNRLLEFIENEFSDSKFVPYIFDTIKVEGLEIRHKLGKNCTISDALFQKYSSYDESINLIGDIRFKLEHI